MVVYVTISIEKNQEVLDKLFKKAEEYKEEYNELEFNFDFHHKKSLKKDQGHPYHSLSAYILDNEIRFFAFAHWNIDHAKQTIRDIKLWIKKNIGEINSEVKILKERIVY